MVCFEEEEEFNAHDFYHGSSHPTPKPDLNQQLAAQQKTVDPNDYVYAKGVVVPNNPVWASGTLPPSSGGLVAGTGLAPLTKPRDVALEAGNIMVERVESMRARDIGNAIVGINEALNLLSDQSFSRSGWENYDRIVRLFQELTGHED